MHNIVLQFEIFKWMHVILSFDLSNFNKNRMTINNHDTLCYTSLFCSFLFYPKKPNVHLIYNHTHSFTHIRTFANAIYEKIQNYTHSHYSEVTWCRAKKQTEAKSTDKNSRLKIANPNQFHYLEWNVLKSFATEL